MRIRADEIPESGRFLHFHWDEGQLGRFVVPEDPFKPKLVRPVNVDLEINKRTDHIRVEGSIEGIVQVTCHRCLKDVNWLMNEPIDVFLVTEERVPDEDETELGPEDLDYEFFDGEVIEIDQLVAEQIFLSLPLKVLCSEACRGICPGCGVNLNDGPCRCEKRTSESPFSKLEAIKTRLPGSN